MMFFALIPIVKLPPKQKMKRIFKYAEPMSRAATAHAHKGHFMSYIVHEIGVSQVFNEDTSRVYYYAIYYMIGKSRSWTNHLEYSE